MLKGVFGDLCLGLGWRRLLVLHVGVWLHVLMVGCFNDISLLRPVMPDANRTDWLTPV